MKKRGIKKKHHIAVFMGIGFVVAAVAMIGSTFTGPQIPNWYATLIKPSGTPPNTIFGPVWTALYTFMVIAAFLVWRKGGVKKPNIQMALVAFFVQLFLNFLWSVLFFGLQSPILALVDIVLLLAAIAWTIVLFRRISLPAAWLLVPYFIWVAFATYLNASIWWLNR